MVTKLRQVQICSCFRSRTCNLCCREKDSRAFRILRSKVSEMLKFQQRATPEDLKIAASIEHKRQIEEARKLRIFNPRVRKIGAEEQQHRRHCEAAQDEEDKKAEIYNHVTGDFLTEAKEQAESIRGPRKPLVDRYKGMTADELKVFRDAQLQQMEEIRKIKLEEKCINENWDHLMDTHLRTVYSYERELNQRKSELNKKIAEENLRLAEQQKQYQEYLNRVVYKNQPTAAFYEQFNKGTR